MKLKKQKKKMEHKIIVMEFKNIKRFWDWFVENCQKFGDNFDNEALLNELDMRVSQLGDFSWEIGPGKVKENSLIISPNGDIDLLKDAKKIIENAEDCNEWEFYYAKQPKQWDLKFDFEIDNGILLKVDANSWEYVLLEFDDGMFEIIIKSEHLQLVHTDDKLSIAEILLDGILGEENRMEYIYSIDMVDTMEEKYQKKCSNIKLLSDHMRVLIENRNRGGNVSN